MKKLRSLAVLLALAGVWAPSATADGLPVLGVDVGPQGVTVPAISGRYVALPAGSGTLVARVNGGAGTVGGSLFVRGRFTIPAVAYDASAGGLSADGRTLVLVRPRVGFPQARTRFLVLGAKGLRVRERLTLRGDFSFDALSPDGRWLYLVQYLSPRDPTRYLVRLYDLRAGRLLSEPVIDPLEVGDVMRGTPLSRAASPDGRWAYTLYDGAGAHPFIHALDTSGRTARCIDLHGLMGYDVGSMYLRGGGAGTLVVLQGSSPMAVVDTRTFRVWDASETATPRAEPAAPAAPEPAPERGSPANDGSLWASLLAPALAVLLVGTAAALVVLRRRIAPA